MSHFKIIRTLTLILLTIEIEAQVKPFTPVNTLDQLKHSVQADSTMEMVDLKKTIPGLIIDLRYASKNNFTRTRMYPQSTQTTYLRKPVALALQSVAEELKGKQLGLMIWDAYRPYDVTVKFWELIQDERFVANPAKGSGHNRGIAVDLTLYDLSTGREISMPTDFDDFSANAYHGTKLVDSRKSANRELLRNTMEKYGFRKLETEWWHYSWPEAERFDVLNIPLKKLKKINHAS